MMRGSKMKRRVLYVLFILLGIVLVSPVYSQTGSFGGARRKKFVEVTIDSNVRGATVVVDKYRGRTPFRVRLEPGRYSITVSAPGYNTFRGRITVSSKRTTQYINIALTPLLVRISIEVTNAKGARVYVDGRYKGYAPARIEVKPGMHSVRIDARGFVPLSTRISVRSSKREERFRFSLKPMNATLDIIIPGKYINRRAKDALRLVKVYVDDKLINRKGEIKGLHVRAGKHRVKIVSGGLSVEGDFNFEAGKRYSVELYMKVRLVNGKRK